MIVRHAKRDSITPFDTAKEVETFLHKEAVNKGRKLVGLEALQEEGGEEPEEGKKAWYDDDYSDDSNSSGFEGYSNSYTGEEEGESTSMARGILEEDVTSMAKKEEEEEERKRGIQYFLAAKATAAAAAKVTAKARAKAEADEVAREEQARQLAEQQAEEEEARRRARAEKEAAQAKAKAEAAEAQKMMDKDTRMKALRGRTSQLRQTLDARSTTIRAAGSTALETEAAVAQKEATMADHLRLRGVVERAGAVGDKREELSRLRDATRELRSVRGNLWQDATQIVALANEAQGLAGCPVFFYRGAADLCGQEGEEMGGGDRGDELALLEAKSEAKNEDCGGTEGGDHYVALAPGIVRQSRRSRRCMMVTGTFPSASAASAADMCQVVVGPNLEHILAGQRMCLFLYDTDTRDDNDGGGGGGGGEGDDRGGGEGGGGGGGDAKCGDGAKGGLVASEFGEAVLKMIQHARAGLGAAAGGAAIGAVFPSGDCEVDVCLLEFLDDSAEAGRIHTAGGDDRVYDLLANPPVLLPDGGWGDGAKHIWEDGTTEGGPHLLSSDASSMAAEGGVGSVEAVIRGAMEGYGRQRGARSSTCLSVRVRVLNSQTSVTTMGSVDIIHRWHRSDIRGGSKMCGETRTSGGGEGGGGRTSLGSGDGGAGGGAGVGGGGGAAVATTLRDDPVTAVFAKHAECAAARMEDEATAEAVRPICLGGNRLTRLLCDALSGGSRVAMIAQGCADKAGGEGAEDEDPCEDSEGEGVDAEGNNEEDEERGRPPVVKDKESKKRGGRGSNNSTTAKGRNSSEAAGAAKAAGATGVASGYGQQPATGGGRRRARKRKNGGSDPSTLLGFGRLVLQGRLGKPAVVSDKVVMTARLKADKLAGKHDAKKDRLKQKREAAIEKMRGGMSAVLGEMHDEQTALAAEEDELDTQLEQAKRDVAFARVQMGKKGAHGRRSRFIDGRTIQRSKNVKSILRRLSTEAGSTVM